MNDLLQPYRPAAMVAGDWMASMARLSGAMATSGWRWMRPGMRRDVHARQGSLAATARPPGSGEDRGPADLPTAWLTSFLASARVMAVCESAEDAGWRDLANKLEATHRFFSRHGADDGDHPAPHSNFSGQVQRLLAHETIYHALWTLEAMGHRRAAQGSMDNRSQSGLPDAFTGLPPGSLVPVHAGAGLALMAPVVESLPAVAPQATDQRVSTTSLEELLHLCRVSALPHHAEILFESLGLLLHNLKPRWLAPVAQRLASIDPKLPAYLWHGAGRGMYFAPSQLLPGGWRRALNKAHRLSDREARRGLTSGFVWALVLVNIRHPEVLADFLRTCHEDIPDSDALIHGTVAPLLVWWRAAGHDPTLQRFLEHVPTSRVARRLWLDVVRRPAQQAFENWLPALERSARWGSLMRFYPRCSWSAGELPAVPVHLSPDVSHRFQPTPAATGGVQRHGVSGP